MRKFLRLLLGIVALSFSLLAFAQDQPITGVVRDSKDGSPLAGATVTNKRTRKSTVTNDYGRYSIQARAGDLLTITNVGRKAQQVTVGNGKSTTVLLESAEGEMGEVVVTAMDIKRNPRELGFSVQTVSGADIKSTQRENFVTALEGRVAGLTVTPTSGTAGASASIVLRGFNTMSGNNQPLFIVDGIILDNQTLNENSQGGVGIGLASDLPNRNNDYTNRIADLNPNDIESITVLKGPEATALYGSQASSGAIVVTSKKGKMTNGKILVTYDDNFRTQKITRFAAINNQYDLGASNGIPSVIPITVAYDYFGPAYSADTKIYDNEHHFFKAGYSQTHDLGLEFGTKKSGFRFSGSYFDDDGVVPLNTYNKYNFKLSNDTKIGKYVEIMPSIQYVNSDNKASLKGASGYLLDLLGWPGTNDIRNYQAPNGGKLIVYNNSYNGSIDNPLWSVKNNKTDDKVTRVVGTLGINVNPFSWLQLAGRFGYDTYEQDSYIFEHPESYLLTNLQGGNLDNNYRRYDGYNHTITATAQKNLGDFSTRLLVGTMWEDLETKAFGVDGTNLKDSTSTDSSNTAPGSRVRLQRNYEGLPNLSIIRELAYFGEASIGYKNVAFLSYSHRFETTSVLPAESRHYNYPSVSLSLIASDIFPMIKSGGVIDYWKLRGSLASTARLPDPYSNQSVFVNGLFSSAANPSYAYGYTNANPNLTPEKQNTYEVGTEMRLFKNLISFEASYYNTLCLNQISEGYRASYATGFILNTGNVSSLRNQGFELTMDVTPVKKANFGWDIEFNFNHMWSKVLTLPTSIGLLNDYYNSDTYFSGNVRGGLVRGHSTGTVTGFDYQRNNKGQVLVDPATGYGLRNLTNVVIGDRTPAFTLGTLNNFRYKNWTLSFLWDLKVGGDIYNGTDYYLTDIGKSARTANRMTPIVVKGVLADGQQNSANPTKNTISIIPYYNTAYYTNLPDIEFMQHNVNWLRLRDVTLNYRMPEKTVKKLGPIKGLNFFLTGNDLILFTNYGGADPAVNGNNPGTAGVGSYGMDYGNTATPLGMSVGLRANL